MVFVPAAQQPPYQPPALGVGPAGRMAIVVRYARNPGLVMREAQARVAAVAPDVPLVYSGEASDLGAPLLEFRNYAATLAVMSIAAIALVLIGLYAMTSALVTRLMRDIGIRVALGAGRLDVGRRIARPILGISAIGGGAGAIGAVLLSPLIASKLWNVDPRNPSAVLFALAVVMTAIAIACWPPLRRALQVDPASVLRSE